MCDQSSYTLSTMAMARVLYQAARRHPAVHKRTESTVVPFTQLCAAAILLQPVTVHKAHTTLYSLHPAGIYSAPVTRLLHPQTPAALQAMAHSTSIAVLRHKAHLAMCDSTGQRLAGQAALYCPHLSLAPYTAQAVVAGLAPGDGNATRHAPKETRPDEQRHTAEHGRLLIAEAAPQNIANEHDSLDLGHPLGTLLAPRVGLSDWWRSRRPCPGVWNMCRARPRAQALAPAIGRQRAPQSAAPAAQLIQQGRPVRPGPWKRQRP